MKTQIVTNDKIETKMKVRSRKHLDSQSGVFLALSAIFSTLILAVIVTYSYNLHVSRQSATALRVFTDALCSELTADKGAQEGQANFNILINNPKLIEARFLTHLNEKVQSDVFKKSGLQLRSARLILPTAVTPSDTSETCNIKDVPYCQIEYTVPLTYPKNLRNPDLGGNTVICEFSARVSGLFLGNENRTVAARSVWRQPVRSQIPEGMPGRIYSLKPGLTILVDTINTNAANNIQYHFNPYENQQYDTIYNPLDPLYIANTFTPKGPTNSTLLFGVSTLGGPAFNLAVVPAIPANSKRRLDLATSCMNPHILMRNTYLSGIVELAARDSQFQDALEILTISPKHRCQQVANGPYTNCGTNQANPPRLVKPFDAVLSSADLSLPLVDYNFISNAATTTSLINLARINFGGGGGVGPSASPTPSGSTAPPPPVTPPTSNWVRDYASLNARQLRMCHHLYASNLNALGAPLGIARFDFHDSDLLATSVNPFPCSTFNDTCPMFSRERVPLNTVVAQQGWELSNTYLPTNTDDGLRASELVSMLGTTQACPMEQIFTAQNCPQCGGDCSSCPFGINPAIDQCRKPIPTSLLPSQIGSELAPDLIAALSFVAGSGSALNARANLAIAPHNDAGNSHILIVLQNAPTTEDEIDRIRALVNKIQDRPGGISSCLGSTPRNFRPITIAYFPTTVDATLSGTGANSTIDRIKNAFCIAGGTTVGNSSLSGNVLYYFSPYTDEYWGKGLPYSPDNNATTPAQKFNLYWVSALDRRSNPIARAAFLHFQRRILMRQLVM